MSGFIKDSRFLSYENFLTDEQSRIDRHKTLGALKQA
jgi:hypothetical protein